MLGLEGLDYNGGELEFCISYVLTPNEFFKNFMFDYL
jgi:hypothetical protein